MFNTDLATICGTYCGSCEDLEKCGGCEAQMARQGGPCEQYRCCIEVKEIEHCGICDEFPCSHFDVNSRGLPDDVFARTREVTIRNLARRAELGTLLWVREVHVAEGTD